MVDQSSPKALVEVRFLPDLPILFQKKYFNEGNKGEGVVEEEKPCELFVCSQCLPLDPEGLSPQFHVGVKQSFHRKIKIRPSHLGSDIFILSEKA